MAVPTNDHDDSAAATPARDDAQAMGDQSPDDVRSSLPPGAGTKPADARGDVDRLEPYEDGGTPLRMSDVDVPPSVIDAQDGPVDPT